MESEDLVLDETPSLEDSDSVLNDWIAGATLTQVPVTIYANQALYAEYLALCEEREILAAEAEGLEDLAAEASIGEESRLSAVTERIHEIDERLAGLHDEWQSSKSVWIIEDISERHDALLEAVGPVPTAPTKPELPKRATEAQQRSHTVKMQEYEAAAKEYEAAAKKWGEDYAFTSASMAVVRVEFSGGRVAHSASPAQLRNLAVTAGDKQIARIHEAIKLANSGKPVIDAPLFLATSHDDQI